MMPSCYLRQKCADCGGGKRGEEFRGRGKIVDAYDKSDGCKSLLDPRMLL